MIACARITHALYEWYGYAVSSLSQDLVTEASHDGILTALCLHLVAVVGSVECEVQRWSLHNLFSLFHYRSCLCLSEELDSRIVILSLVQWMPLYQVALNE